MTHVGREMRLHALVAVLLLGATDAPKFELPASARALFDTGKWDATPKSFRIIALSQLADGCAAQGRARPEFAAEARACVEAALRRARELPASSNALHLSHLNLIYGAGDATGACLDEAEHARLSRLLGERSLAEPLKHAASYSGQAFRWPADQSATLASLSRFDAAHGMKTSEAPIAAWREVVMRTLDEKTSLPRSELSGTAPGAKFSRGCANSFLVRYTSEFDPVLAASWWRAYQTHFLTRIGPTVGFREWPNGVERKADIDSGPIILGIGAAASALSISAAKSQGDDALAAELEASQQAALLLAANEKAVHGVLPESIAFEGRWHRAKNPVSAR